MHRTGDFHTSVQNVSVCVLKSLFLAFSWECAVAGASVAPSPVPRARSLLINPCSRKTLAITTCYNLYRNVSQYYYFFCRASISCLNLSLSMFSLCSVYLLSTVINYCLCSYPQSHTCCVNSSASSSVFEPCVFLIFFSLSDLVFCSSSFCS